MKFKKLSTLSLSVMMSASMLVGCGSSSSDESSKETMFSTWV